MLPQAFFCLDAKETIPKRRDKAHKSQSQKLPRFSFRTANRSSLADRSDSALRSSATQTFVVFYVCYLMAAGAQGKSLFYFWLARGAKNPHEEHSFKVETNRFAYDVRRRMSLAGKFVLAKTRFPARWTNAQSGKMNFPFSIDILREAARFGRGRRRAERKETVQWTVLAKVPGGAVARLEAGVKKQMVFERSEFICFSRRPEALAELSEAKASRSPNDRAPGIFATFSSPK
ncbi:hypothetical protein SAMN02927903_02695 [Flavobacterium caeni]|uniref:Uncharacterized protein n=2 Tax=Flavobacterium caeni TaxID=490189 RepID=A0A1G5JHR5_9FLAO|nr:hypothetical protein SAMN02927903_02695 [Flavobacterium caeni]